MHDHPFAIIEFEVSDEILNIFQWTENKTEELLVKEEYIHGKGPLGWTGRFTFATFRLPDSTWDEVNDTHYTAPPADRPQALLEYTSVPFTTGTNLNYVTVWTALVQEESTGNVTLNSSDYRDDPIIVTNYFATS